MNDPLRPAAEPRDVARDRLDYYRWLQTEESTEFGATFTDTNTGEVHSYAHWAPTALEAHEQLELNLPGYSLHHSIRRSLADALEQRVLPLLGAKWVHNYIDRLRGARWSGAYGYSVAKGKAVMFWDDKAGLSRLCPDDAREEAQRLSRKVLGPLEALQADNHALHYCVLTTPNAPAGALRREMVGICRRLRNSILKAKHPDGSLVFPEIKGALCVLEAPLGSARDWNVHLNVIFVVKGYFDYEKLRRIWHWNLEIKKLATGPGVIRGALTELIKYAVAATVAKSAHKAQDAEADQGRPPPPAMLEWTGSELLEWLRAMRGFRRTRTYGCLFRLKKPKAEDMGQIIWLGRVDYQGGRYRLSSTLLGSIPEDNFSGRTPRERWEALVRSLAPGGLAGAGTLGDTIPPLTQVHTD
ncbi:MAG: hypothetical protein ACRETD_03085 [Steroidobacteraceae bacterium]